MTDESSAHETTPSRARRLTRTVGKEWQDLLAVGLLSAVAVVTAWCGFQASKWGGEMSISFSQASSARVQASDAARQAGDQRQVDLTIYSQWVVATASDEDELAAYIEERFPPTLATAFEAWDGGAGSPFSQPEYVLPDQVRAEELNARADTAYETALRNNQRGDNYALLTVLFALVLFLTAMSQRKGTEWAEQILLTLAVVGTVIGLVILFTFPIRI
jgi:hypothetical protein